MRLPLSLTLIACLVVSARPVTAQLRVRTLAPGTEIIVTVKGAPAGRRYLVLADDESAFTVLNLADPRLPRAARDVLRDIAAKHPSYFVRADRHESFVNGTVRVEPDGVFVADRKGADLGQLIEHVARGDVAEITRPGGAPLTTLTTDRPVEVGVGSGGVMSWAGGGGDLRVTVTVPRNERRSMEAFAGIYRGDDFVNTRGVYGFQIKQPIVRWRRPGFEPFATFGAMGVIARAESTDCRTAPCRHDVSTRVLPPFLGLAGLGAQYAVTPRVAVRVEAQAGVLLFFPVGVRVSAGVAIPIGRVASSGPAAVSR